MRLTSLVVKQPSALLTTQLLSGAFVVFLVALRYHKFWADILLDTEILIERKLHNYNLHFVWNVTCLFFPILFSVVDIRRTVYYIRGP